MLALIDRLFDWIEYIALRLTKLYHGGLRLSGIAMMRYERSLETTNWKGVNDVSESGEKRLLELLGSIAASLVAIARSLAGISLKK